MTHFRGGQSNERLGRGCLEAFLWSRRRMALSRANPDYRYFVDCGSSRIVEREGMPALKPAQQELDGRRWGQ